MMMMSQALPGRINISENARFSLRDELPPDLSQYPQWLRAMVPCNPMLN